MKRLVLCPACSFRRPRCPVCGGEGQVTEERAQEIEKRQKGERK